MIKIALERPLDASLLSVSKPKGSASPRLGEPRDPLDLFRPLAERRADKPALPTAKPKGWYLRAGKRTIDLAVVVLSAPFTLPVIGLCAAALWIESGPPFYRQDRMRADGTRYKILKLRTMVRDADAMFESLLASDPELRREWDEAQKLKNDPRITPVGRFLRTTSLDELPQLWNVLTGDMSLIGPRPVLPSQVVMYGPGPLYFGMKPGVSGLWQVSTRNDRGFAHRAEMDELYEKGICYRMDFSIFLKTLGVMLRRTGH
jgi:lipopolysaccharide/colanic/teichoic acid biosynthesis glycosyltransferase